MARPLTCCSPCRNPPSTGGNEFAGPTPTEGSDIYTLACAISRAPTLALAHAPALLLAPAPVDANATVKYLEANLKRIFRTVLEARPPVPALSRQPFVFLEGPCEKPLKARFLELYCGKTHIECYNFCQQYEDHFATAGAKGHNWVPFAATFL